MDEIVGLVERVHQWMDMVSAFTLFTVMALGVIALCSMSIAVSQMSMAWSLKRIKQHLRSKED